MERQLLPNAFATPYTPRTVPIDNGALDERVGHAVGTDTAARAHRAKVADRHVGRHAARALKRAVASNRRR